MSREEVKKVFKTCDLIERAWAEKRIFSAEVFDAIVDRARKGEIEAVRWLTEYGFISLRRHKPPVQVTADVLKGIEALRAELGDDRMQNYRDVISVRNLVHLHPNTVQWVWEHESEYAAGLVQGFTLEEQPDGDDDEAVKARGES